MKKKFYVTTPIYYVTAAPHLGSLYSTLLADVFARYHTLVGSDVFFLTGTDEHGQKVAQAAQKINAKPKEFVDSFINSYKNIWKLYNLDYTKFIRTTDTYHVKGVQLWLQRLIDKGDVYKDFYKGFYCTPCETFVTEKASSSAKSVMQNSNNDGDDACRIVNDEIICPSCQRATVEVAEECYFFRLSAYADKLLEFYEQHPDFITPKERAQEVISFIKSGLQDLSLSRKTVTWGIPFPGDEHHVTYVWADALNNYITAIGYGDLSRVSEFEKWWPADLQILGKDIVRFHAIYWPAFLMASKLALPKKLLVHGWIKVNNQKMSKSLGNAVNPEYLAKTYGVDQIRYYLVRKMAITQDSEFRIEDIEQSINSELANDLGNLLNRCSTLAIKYSFTTIEAPQSWSPKSGVLQGDCLSMIQESWSLVESGYLYRAVNRIWEFINKTNAYFHELEPWVQVRKDKKSFEETIAATIYSLQAIGVMLWPIMPEKMNIMLESIGFEWEKDQNILKLLQENFWKKSCSIQKIDTLFTKHELTAEDSKGKSMENAAKQLDEKALMADSGLNFEEFLKVDMRIGTIKECELVAGSDKLLKMQVDFGSLGMRQILSGIQQSYTPLELIGTQGVFVVNLKPRKMMGIESQGMMLMTSDLNGLQRLMPSKGVVPGSRIS